MIQKKWENRPIVRDTDADKLEHRAALLEFGDGIPRHQAEEQAHSEYIAQVHREAAAHHLRGLRAAQASGDHAEARKHGESYHHHMTRLGHDSMDQVPDDIKELVEDEEKSTHYKFKAHAADKLLFPESEE